MSNALIELLVDDDLRAAMAQRAYRYGRGMLWSRVAAEYQQLFMTLPAARRDIAVQESPVAVPSA
jgi:hypothetical protein